MFRNQNITPSGLDCSDLLFISVEYESQYKNKRLKSGDLLTMRTGYPGVTAIVPKEYEGSQSFTTLITRPNMNSVVTSYLCCYINSAQGRKFFEQSQIGGAQKNVNVATLKTMLIPVPPTLSEQEAIAGALSDADAWIESLEQLIAKKRQIKQGAMQELLTGKRRLPGFSGKWETKQIGLIADVGRGRVINHREIARSRNPKYPVYSSQTSNDGVMGFIDSFDFEGEFVTWTTDGANAGTVFARKGRFNCTNVCGTIEVKQGDYRCIALALGRVAKNHVSKHLGNPKLMNDVMKRIEVCVPSSIAEQTAIATVLSDMDTEIESLESKLAKAREIKQGMMQELLTGSIRLV